VDDDVPLVTLTGPGGIGKTRLALDVALRVRDGFADGVWFVDLSPLRDAALVAATIAQVLDLREIAGLSAMDRLRAFLAERQVLLVLDNFEQVAAAGPEIAVLLESCPRLTLLVTSRMPLHVSGEHRYPVPPLSTPDPARSASLADGGAAAIELFCRAARSVRPGFELTASNAGTVAAICARLDGLPLAIELAAARSNVLSPQALLERLDHALALLTGGSRGVPARLRSMRDAIGWSYDLLDAREQRLFRCLAVFSGGFTEAAAAIMTEGMDSGSVANLDLLSALLETNLIHEVVDNGPETRFAILETIREFGLEQLAASDGERSARQAHLHYFAERGDELWTTATTEGAQSLFRQMFRDLDNVRTALTWALDHAPAEALRLAGALGYFWMLYGLFAEGFDWLERALAATPDDPGYIRARALLSAGWVASHRGDDQRADRYLTEAIARSRRVENGDILLSLALACLGPVALRQDDLKRARQLYDEELRIARALGHSLPLAVATLNQGQIAMEMGDLPRALSFFEESLAIHQRANGLTGVATAHLFLGIVKVEMQDHDGAASHYLEAISLFAGAGDQASVATAIEGLVNATFRRNPASGVQLLGAAAAVRERLGRPPDRWEQSDIRKTIDTVRAMLGDAEYAAAWAAGQTLSLDDAIAIALQIEAAPVPQGSGSGAARRGVTRRELDVLCLVAGGRTDQEIADALFISRRTVNTHVSHLLAKLDVPTRKRAVALAREERLLLDCPVISIPLDS
jgi:non-specific serine/threonine protein kinase